MMCPSCEAHVYPERVIVLNLTVCQGCARSLVLDDGVARFATAEDIRALTPAQITELRQARPAAWRKDVRARHSAIVGGRG